MSVYEDWRRRREADLFDEIPHEELLKMGVLPPKREIIKFDWDDFSEEIVKNEVDYRLGEYREENPDASAEEIEQEKEHIVNNVYEFSDLFAIYWKDHWSYILEQIFETLQAISNAVKNDMWWDIIKDGAMNSQYHITDKEMLKKYLEQLKFGFSDYSSKFIIEQQLDKIEINSRGDRGKMELTIQPYRDEDEDEE